jgi:hypothetical protein
MLQKIRKHYQWLPRIAGLSMQHGCDTMSDEKEISANSYQRGYAEGYAALRGEVERQAARMKALDEKNERLFEENGKLANKLGSELKLLAKIARLRAALRTARGQLITIGGDYCGPDCDQIQCAVLKEIETALHGTAEG